MDGPRNPTDIGQRAEESAGVLLRGALRIDTPRCHCGTSMTPLRQPNPQSAVFECRATRSDEECGTEVLVCVRADGVHPRMFWSTTCPPDLSLSAYARRQLGVQAERYGFRPSP